MGRRVGGLQATVAAWIRGDVCLVSAEVAVRAVLCSVPRTYIDDASPFLYCVQDPHSCTTSPIDSVTERDADGAH
jgi:hypothetical protein